MALKGSITTAANLQLPILGSCPFYAYFEELQATQKVVCA